MWAFTKRGKSLKEVIWRDPLTNALNGAVVRRHGPPERRNLNEQFLLIFVDVNKFKQINDLYGHEFGDKMLIRISDALHREFCRETDLVMRQGGDEFIVLLPNTTYEFAEEKMQRINKSLRIFTISYGIEMCRSLGDIDKALNQADFKMYQMKNATT